MGSSPAGTVKSSVAQLVERLKMGSVNFTGLARAGFLFGNLPKRIVGIKERKV